MLCIINITFSLELIGQPMWSNGNLGFQSRLGLWENSHALFYLLVKYIDIPDINYTPWLNGSIFIAWIHGNIWGISTDIYITGLRTPISELHIHIWSDNFRSPTGQKVKPNMADMEGRSYVGLSPPARFLYETRKHERPRRGTETVVTQGLHGAIFDFTRKPEDLTPDIYIELTGSY